MPPIVAAAFLLPASQEDDDLVRASLERHIQAVSRREVIPAPWDGALLPAEEEITPSPIEATPAAVVGLDLDALVTDDTLPSQQEGTPSDRARAVVTGDREAGTRRRLWRSQAAPPSSVVDTGEDSL